VIPLCLPSLPPPVVFEAGRHPTIQ
jgi:hypothetical protein